MHAHYATLRANAERGTPFAQSAIQKRLATDIKKRKSVRLTVFDSIRNLPQCEAPAPAPVSVAQSKVEHRRQQLEKWKVEKEQKRKEMAAQKKKPFLAGVAKAPLKFVPPPPPPPKPSSSGRVTRSQTKKLSVKPTQKSPVKSTSKTRQTQSFAPKNATFKPPEFKNLPKIPSLAPPSKSKKKVSMITFDPVVPNTVAVKQTRSRPALTRQNATEVKPNRNKPETRNTRSNFACKSTEKFTVSTQSSSESDMDSKKVTKRIKIPAKQSAKDAKPLPTKVLYKTDSSSDSTMEKSIRLPPRKSIIANQSDSDQLSSEISASSAEKSTVTLKSRKSVPKNFSPRPLTSGSSTDQISTDLEFAEDPSPVKPARKSMPCTPKNKNVPKSESSSEEKLRSPKVSIELPLTPEQMEVAKMSPCVTMSRGKDNARKEMRWKIDEGYLDDDVSDADSIDHFRHQLSSEIKRLTEMCDTWDKISAQTVLPESVQEAILAAVGQARLLMSQKLQQFAALVERCARPEPGTALVTPTDLHGFWDMVFMQVVNVDMRFKKLDELRARNWTDEAAVPRRVKKLTKVTSKPDNKAKPVANSRIKDMIAAARKAKKQEVQPQVSSDAPPSEGEKSFDAGFFTVRSPVKIQSPRIATPNKTTLLKAVLSSEAKKASSKNTTPFAMLRASIMAKNVDGVAPLPQTPQMTPMSLFATPGRSILKSTNAKQSAKSDRKSVKTVLFDQSDSDLNQSFSSEITSDKYQTPALELKDTAHVDKENYETTIVRTRHQMKMISNTEENTPRRSSRKKTEERQSVEVKSKVLEDDATKPRRSSRKKALQEFEANVMEAAVATPKRSSRRSKALVA